MIHFATAYVSRYAADGNGADASYAGSLSALLNDDCEALFSSPSQTEESSSPPPSTLTASNTSSGSTSTSKSDAHSTDKIIFWAGYTQTSMLLGIIACLLGAFI